MQNISFTHKLEVCKSGCAHYDVAVGDVVEIGLNSITVDSSSKHHSDVIPIEINDITDIKVMNRRA